MANPVVVNFDQTKTLIAFAERAQKHDLAVSDLQVFIDKPDTMVRLVGYIKAGAPDWQVLVLPDINWAYVYQKLGMEAEYQEFAKTVNWNDPNLWIVPVVNGATCNKVVAAMKNDGVKFWLYAKDLDASLSRNDRDPNKDGSYVIGFRRTIEADEENKNLSAEMLAEQKHRGGTLLERLLLGAGYFWTTGQHLDVKNVTLSAGSCNLDSNVPSVFFSSDSGKVFVSRYSPGSRDDDLRSRSAVPPPVAEQLA